MHIYTHTAAATNNTHIHFPYAHEKQKEAFDLYVFCLEHDERVKVKIELREGKKNANASYFIFRVFHVCKPFIGVKVFIFNFEPCDACVQSIAFEHFLIDSRSSANMYPYHTSCFGR